MKEQLVILLSHLSIRSIASRIISKNLRGIFSASCIRRLRFPETTIPDRAETPRGARTERSWGADNDAICTLELLCQVDLVSGRALDQDVEVGQRVAGLDKGSPSVVEERPLRACPREGGGEASGCEHGECLGKER